MSQQDAEAERRRVMITKFLLVKTLIVLTSVLFGQLPKKIPIGINNRKGTSKPDSVHQVYSETQDSLNGFFLQEVKTIQAELDSTKKVNSEIRQQLKQKRSIALLAERWGIDDWTMDVLTLILILAVWRQLVWTRKTVNEMRNAANLNVGGVDIDFRGEKVVESSSTGEGKFRFVINFSIISTGSVPIRITSINTAVCEEDWAFIGNGWRAPGYIEGLETPFHLIIKPDAPVSLVAVSEYEFSRERVLQIKDVLDPRYRMMGEKLCFYGILRYQNGAGEAWVKPFFFYFVWDESGNAIPQPRDEYCSPEKEYSYTLYFRVRMAKYRAIRFFKSLIKPEPEQL